ncbi:MAG: DUF1080 domain-containing protein [Phycisphaeraceae bacterium]
MLKQAAPLLALVVCSLLGCRAASQCCATCQADGDEPKPISLFNGKDLTGWTPDVPAADDKPDIEPSFIVRDGLLVSKGRPLGHLISDGKYKDYRLVVEYRFAAKPGNCGVLVHASTPRALSGMFPQSIEVQLMNRNAGDFWCIHENIAVPEMHTRRNGPPESWGGKRGQNRHIRNLTDGSENPVGEWNTLQIECLDDKVRVWVNGDLVNDGFDATVRDGKIALQAEGSEVEFRRVDLTPITELTPAKDLPGAKPKTISLFDGKTLDGWYADVPKADDNPDIDPSFIVRDGNLVSMGVPRGHLITKASYKDYRLEVQYRFPGKPGNCGVLVHTDGKRPRVLYDMFPASLEVQMQSGSAGDFWCIHEDIKVPNMAERRGGKPDNWGGKQGQGRHIKNLTDGSEKKLGEWNTMIIECLGDKIRVWVNGDLVNDGYDCTASSGQISLQAEGAEVEFRKLVLTPISELTVAKNRPISE